MTDPTDSPTVVELVAGALAAVLGLGDEAVATDDWPVDEGDTVLRGALDHDGAPAGEIVLAVNDDVARRLLDDGTALTQAFADATAAVATQLGRHLAVGPVAPGPTARPGAIANVVDQGRLTAVVGLELADTPEAAAPQVIAGFEASELSDVPTAPAAHTDTGSAGALGALADLGALSVLRDVDMVVTAELGRTTMPMRELLGLSPGMVVEIDRAAGAPIDLLVNGRRIATGEVVVIDEEFGIRITEISPGSEHRR
jgi:flagellar motor switch protein FliN/FliY